MRRHPLARVVSGLIPALVLLASCTSGSEVRQTSESGPPPGSEISTGETGQPSGSAVPTGESPPPGSEVPSGEVPSGNVPASSTVPTSPSEGPASQTSVPPDDPATAGHPLGLLDNLVAPGTDRYEIYFGDLVAIGEANGIPRPEAGDIDGLIDWAGAYGLDEVPGLIPDQLGRNMMAMHDEFRDELGLSLWDMDAFAGMVAPPHHMTAASGTFDTAAMTAAMGAPVDGMWSLGGEDLELDLTDRTAARSLGESLRIGMPDDDTVVLSRETPPLRAVLDSTGERLSDDANLAAAAHALIQAGAISGILARGDSAGGAGLPGAFDTVGIGIRADLSVAVVYVTQSEADAQANADALEKGIAEGTSINSNQPYTDLLTLTDVSVTGNLLIAGFEVAEGKAPNLLISMWAAREPILTSAG